MMVEDGGYTKSGLSRLLRAEALHHLGCLRPCKEWLVLKFVISNQEHWGKAWQSMASPKHNTLTCQIDTWTRPPHLHLRQTVLHCTFEHYLWLDGQDGADGQSGTQMLKLVTIPLWPKSTCGKELGLSTCQHRNRYMIQGDSMFQDIYNSTKWKDWNKRKRPSHFILAHVQALASTSKVLHSASPGQHETV